MKKIEMVYREILRSAMEKRKGQLTQSELAKSLGISLSTVNHALKPLRKMGAIRVKPRGLEVVSAKKTLFYWASIRNLESDIIYRTRASRPVIDIEKGMPGDIVFGGYSAYKFMFKSVPADYSEVYVYADSPEEIKKRFPESKNPPNIFVLKREFDSMTVAHLFVDLWNMKEWYAREFVMELEGRLEKMGLG